MILQRLIGLIDGGLSLNSLTSVLLKTMASGINIYSSFQISKIIILDIENNYSGYPK